MTQDTLPLSEPYYLILFRPSMGQIPYRPTISWHESLWQYLNGKMTLPHGFDRDLVAVLPCLWYCLQLPRTRYDLVHVPITVRKNAQRFHLPQHIFLLPVPWPSIIVSNLNNGFPKLILTSDNLLTIAKELATGLDHVVDVTSTSALDVRSLQRHWQALHAALGLNQPQHILPSHLINLETPKAALMTLVFVARHLRNYADTYCPKGEMPQPEILHHALNHQVELSAIARLEALHTPPKEAEAIYPPVLEEEGARFQCPVSVGIAGVSSKLMQRELEKALHRAGIRADLRYAESKAHPWSS